MGVVYTLGMDLARFQKVSKVSNTAFPPKERNSPLWVPSRVLWGGLVVPRGSIHRHKEAPKGLREIDSASPEI